MARIVLVEDSDALRESISRALTEGGHEVTALGSAEQGLARVREDPPDLLVTDVILPGMSGIALVEAVRERHDRLELPVVIVSSLDATEEVTRGYSAGADDYLLKPVVPRELRARVSVLLERREHAQAASETSKQPQWKRYERQQLLGQNDSATVHRARRRGDDLSVVLKAVRPGAPAHVTEHLLREAELLRTLGELPHMARIRDVGQDGGCAYYAMEWVPGRSLRTILDERGRMPFGEAARVGRGLAQALASLSTLGVVHGDVKPANVVIKPDGEPVLIDFGLAHRVGEPDSGHRGTLAYVAPEVLRGDPGTPAADVYAFGVLLYECICRGFPYHARGDELAALKIEGAPPELGTLLELDVPPGLIAVVESCLEVETARRAQVERVVTALLPYEA